MQRVSGMAFDGGAPRLSLQISGVRLDLLTRDADLLARAREYFAGYPGRGAATAELYVETSREAELWEDEDSEFDVREDAVVQRDFAAKRLTSAKGLPIRAVALMGPELDDATHNLLRWFLPEQLLARDAFLLHGAGAIRDGHGYVFFGQSGAGKSTSVSLIAAADPRARVLGDDAVIVQLLDGIPYLCSAPLGCGYSRLAPPPMRAPLRGLFALTQGPEHRIERISPAAGAAALLASAMCVRFDQGVESRMELAIRFARSSAGIRRLHFRRDAGFWSKIIQNQPMAEPSPGGP